VIGNSRLSVVSRLILGGVFAYAGVTKAFNPGALAAAIRTYELGLPEWFVSVAAHALPYVEILLGIYLIAGLFTRISAWATNALMLVFILALAQGALRGLEIECGCFGASTGTAQGSLWLDALRDVGLLLLGLQIALAPVSRLSVDALLGRAGEGASETA
jgi:uncharacterized membrane protein YphA (DoxX/SURF4 family)